MVCDFRHFVRPNLSAMHCGTVYKARDRLETERDNIKYWKEALVTHNEYLIQEINLLENEHF